MLRSRHTEKLSRIDAVACSHTLTGCLSPSSTRQFMIQEDCSDPDWPGLPEERIQELIEKHVALLPRSNSNGSDCGSDSGVRDGSGGARGNAGSAECASSGADNGGAQRGGDGAGFQRYYILQDDSEFILVHKPPEA